MTFCLGLFQLSQNFSDWFTVGEGDNLLVSTLLPMPITRTTPSVLLVLGRIIFYFRMSSNHKWTEKTMTDFWTSWKWRWHEMHNLEYKLFYYPPAPQKKKLKGMYAK